MCNTTCLVSDTFDDSTSGVKCYQSYCVPPNISQFEINPHRIEMQGILCLNKAECQIELQKIDVYCRADDCSQPEIFKEIRHELTFALGDLSALRNLTCSTMASTAQFYSTKATSTPPFYNPNSCNSSLLMPGLNGSCITIIDANNEAIDFLLNLPNTADSTQIANALTVYFSSISNPNLSQHRNRTLPLANVDTLVGFLNYSVTLNAATSFIICRPTDEKDIALGASFQSGSGGQIIKNSTEADIINSNLTAAAILNPSSLIGADTFIVDSGG
ncbi:unnamed protein product [Rotaria sordida]|uniref:Uncharacterized protein n=1 Tax=Rotaria sordida TaxID=392033 RepID=A0A814AJ78_9BILA|nr:unnamed protein product [Rotaria sordida]CAF1050633.1 unnamed protein product [Rotaria sordida]